MTGTMDTERIYVTKSSMPPYEEYIEAIKPLWDTHRITNMGEYHKKLEKELKEYLAVPDISVMVNGHMALEMVIQSFDFPEGSEVITTPFTFISTTHAIIRNHLKPIFCDVKLSDGTIDEMKIERLITEKTVAILPVHVYGNICNVEYINYIADKHDLKVIYDAAHAFGVKYKGIGIGNYGDVSVFSFHATKVFNTIEGGGITFSDSKLYDVLYNLKNFGIRGEERVVSIGANAKMNEFSAIMGLCNLKYVDINIAIRQKYWDIYMNELREVKGISFFRKNPDVKHNYSYFPIIVDNYCLSRDELYEYFREHNIYVRKYFYPLTADQKCFDDKYKKNEIKMARYLSEHILILPLYPDMKIKDLRRIIGIIKEKSR